MGKNKDAPPPERSRRAGETSRLMPVDRPTNNINNLPQDLLELLLLHVPSSVDLLRAAATCKLWRRVIAAGFFLRRFRRLHSPDVLGHYYGGWCKAFFVPSPTPPGEATVDLTGHVTLDFLAHHYIGNLQLSDGGCSSLLAFVNNSSTVLVCDPWTRQHRELTPYSPWKGSSRRGGRNYSSITIGAFFLPAADDASHVNNMSCFRLLCVSVVIKCDGTNTKTAWATVYSATDDRWISLGSRDVPSAGSYWTHACSRFLGRAGGSLCWSGDDVSNAVLHLDESSGAFSTFTLPADARHDHRSSYHRGNLRLIGSGGSGSGFVLLARVIDDDLEVLRWSRGHECIVERKVCLSRLAGIGLLKVEWSWRFLDTAQTVTPGHVVLLPHEGCVWMFDVDVETMVMMRLDKRNSHAYRVVPYHPPWPPTIKVCV